jgi:hypothetical protein
MTRDTITDTGITAAAEELYHVASRGKEWNTAPREVRDDFRGIARRMMERAATAELAEQSRQREGREWRLP